VELPTLAFVGLVLVDMPLSRGKLPFASRLLVIPWAKAGVAERKMNTRAILIRACHLSRGAAILYAPWRQFSSPEREKRNAGRAGM
jgi:hypothetical protein